MREAWRGAVLDAEGLVATDYIVVEAVAVAQRRWGLDAVRVLVDELIPLIEIQPVSADERIAAVNALLAAGRRHLSLVDCVSFVTMRRMGIRDYLGTADAALRAPRPAPLPPGAVRREAPGLTPGD